MDDLEQLQKTFDGLQENLISLNQEAAKALAGIKNKGEAVIDVERWNDQKRKIQIQIPIIESRLLQAKIKQLLGEREAAKAELERLRPELVAASEDYDARLKSLEESFIKHGKLQAVAYNLDQTVVQTWEEVQEKKRQLRDLIQSVTGVEEVEPDGLSNTVKKLVVVKTTEGEREFSYDTDNLLIRN
jgi:hypothetical protein